MHSLTQSHSLCSCPAQILALSVNISPPHNLRLILAAVIFLQRYLEWKISDCRGPKTFLPWFLSLGSAVYKHCMSLHVVFQDTGAMKLINVAGQIDVCKVRLISKY